MHMKEMRVQAAISHEWIPNSPMLIMSERCVDTDEGESIYHNSQYSQGTFIFTPKHVLHTNSNTLVQNNVKATGFRVYALDETCVECDIDMEYNS